MPCQVEFQRLFCRFAAQKTAFCVHLGLFVCFAIFCVWGRVGFGQGAKRWRMKCGIDAAAAHDGNSRSYGTIWNLQHTKIYNTRSEYVAVEDQEVHIRPFNCTQKSTREASINERCFWVLGRQIGNLRLQKSFSNWKAKLQMTTFVFCAWVFARYSGSVGAELETKHGCCLMGTQVAACERFLHCQRKFSRTYASDTWTCCDTSTTSFQSVCLKCTRQSDIWFY